MFIVLILIVIFQQIFCYQFLDTFSKECVLNNNTYSNLLPWLLRCGISGTNLNCYQLYDLVSQLPPDSVILPNEPGFNEAIQNDNLRYEDTLIPGVVILPHDAVDIQTIVLFANELSIQVTIRSGGHSYERYYTNNGGIQVNLDAYMSEISINEDTMTATVQSGITWLEVYEHLESNYPGKNYMVVGGLCPTVGVAGYTLGGGISAFSRLYGLGIDNVIEMTVVTADGELLTLNNDNTNEDEKDLFWAMKGSGGGNFAIMTDFVTNVHLLRGENSLVWEINYCWWLPSNEDNFNNAMNYLNVWQMPYYMSVFPSWIYWFNEETKHYEMKACFQIFINSNDDFNTLESTLLKPFIDNSPDDELTKICHNTWYDYESGICTGSDDTATSSNFNNTLPQNIHYGSVYAATKYHAHSSVILGFGTVTPEVVTIIEELVDDCPTYTTDPESGKRCHILWDHMGGVTTHVLPQDTAFYWRQGVYTLSVRAVWDDPEREQVMMDWIALTRERLTPFALNQKAAYINYIDGNLSDWQYSYYGELYPELQRIKQIWDPNNFFHFKQSIQLPSEYNCTL